MRKVQNHNQQIFQQQSALQKLIQKPAQQQEKSQISVLNKQLQSLIPMQLNESFRQGKHTPIKQNPNNSQLHHATQQHHYIQPKIQKLALNMSNNNSLEKSMQQSSTSDQQGSPSKQQYNLYGFTTKSNVSKKPVIGSQKQIINQKPIPDYLSQRTLDESKDSDYYKSKLQTQYQVKEQQESQFKDDNSSEIYQQIIRMRSAARKTENKQNETTRCQKHCEKIKFSNIDKTQEFCCICAIQQAFKGNPIIYLKTQQIVTYQATTESRNEHSPQAQQFFNIDTICQQREIYLPSSKEFNSKKQDLQAFINSLQKSSGFVTNLIMDYQGYLQSQDVSETNQSNITKYLQVIQNEMRTILTQKFNGNDMSFKKVLNEKLSYIQSFQKDLDSIKRDIFQNIENILKQMELDPFKLILKKYTSKIGNFEAQIKQNHQILQEQFQVTFAASFQLDESVRLMITKFLDTSTKVDKENLLIEQEKNKQVYVSFENKELFAPGNTNNKENEVQKTPKHNPLLELSRASQTSKFVELLNKLNQPNNYSIIDNVSQNSHSKDDSTTSFENQQRTPIKFLLNSPHFYDTESYQTTFKQ